MKLMKHIFYLCLFMVPMYALQLTMNSGKEEGKSFSVLRLSHTEPFSCEESYNRFSEVEKVVCKFNGVFERGFSFEQTLFFKIDAFQDKEKGVIVITPKKRARLFPLNQDSKSPVPIVKEKATLASSWQIIGYEEKIPFLKMQQPVGLNFPITMKNVSTPYIGALDIAKKPLVVQETPDTQAYISIKGFMDRESYQEAINAINETLLRYPNTIFKKDLLLFKIDALFNLNNQEYYEEMVALAKAWLKAYPADHGVSEVLYVLAKTYGEQRFYDESRYYYDRLKEEYKGNEFEILSRISFANDLQNRGDSKLAPQLYISALNDTQNVKTASLAAYNLADYYILKGGDREAAKKLLEQVIEVNPKFFTTNPQQTFNKISKWADEGFYDPTAKIAEIIYESIKDNINDNLQEVALRSAAIWHENAKQFLEATQAYKKYLQTYPVGDMHKEMLRRSDNLLFSYNEGNSTKRIEDLERLIKTYPNSEESKKAYEQKAEILTQEGDFASATALEEHLGAENPIVIQAATGAVRKALHSEDCATAAFYLQKYKNLDLNQDELMGGFDCLVQKSFYNDALRISEQAQDSIDSTVRRLQWLYRVAKTQETKGDYPKAIFAARDALYISDSLGNAMHNDIIFTLVNALLKEKRVEEAMQYMPRLEETFKDDDRMIDIQKELLNAAAKKDDRPAIEIYAQELLRLQALHQRPEYSPWVELTYAESLIKSNRLQEALAVLNQAEQLPLSNDDRAKVLYNKGAIADSLQLTPLSLESYQQCSQLEGNSPYKQLCSSAYTLLQERANAQDNQEDSNISQ